MSTPQQTDTIVAPATARQAAAIAVLRLSGPTSHAIAARVAGKVTPPRIASLVTLRDAWGQTIDQALQLIFPAPASFTGEDMVEWHCHGGQLVVDLLLKQALELGARAAEAGEFTKRAFLNGKLDLHQAEAIAGLIAAGSRRMARLAAGSLCGGLAKPLTELTENLDWCRTQVETSLDFSDESIDPASHAAIGLSLSTQQQKLEAIIRSADANLAYVHSPQVLLAGQSNTGKSSLFNCLLGAERALVSEQAGTTRDLLRESLECGDTSIRLTDSAGLRTSDDAIEQAGIRLASDQIANSDVLLLVFDARAAVPQQLWRQIQQTLLKRDSALASPSICWIANKIDLTQHAPHLGELELDGEICPCIWTSAATGVGVNLLRDWLITSTQPQIAAGETGDAFLVRQRHLDALHETAQHLAAAALHLAEGESSLELAAESLRLARTAVGELTGQSASEELLGKIFAQFCIGK